MNAIELLLRQPVAQAIGWALLQFVWQGALVGMLTAAALLALRRSAADVRYVVATIGLSLMLTMPSVTALQAWRAMTDAPSAQVVAPSSIPPPGRMQFTLPAELVPIESRADRPGHASTSAGNAAPAVALRSEIWLRLAFVVWLSGVAILTLRLMTGWIWVQRLKSHSHLPAPEGWQHIACRLSRRLHITRPIRLLQSAVVDVPTVIGWLQPIVLLPASALAGMAPPQLEAILAHELAHIRRHDYLVNLLQTLVETLLFYHPAVWWVSRRIRIERENCCDDLAVSLCGDPYTYARALADLEELRAGAGRLALAATGGSLLYRVRRLLGAPSHAGRAPGWLAGAAAVVLIAGIAVGALGKTALGAERSSPASAVVPLPPAQSQPSPKLPASAARRPNPSTQRPVAPAIASTFDVQPASSPTPVVAAQTLISEAIGAIVAEAAAQFPTWPATPPTPPTPPAPPPTPATRPTPPTSPTPPTPPTGFDVDWGFSGVSQTRDRRGNFTWSDGKQKLEVRYEGAIEFTDDDSDVKSLSRGGWLRIKEGGWLSSRTVEFQADASGNVQRRYWVGSSEKPFNPEGRQWLTEVLPRFIRQTGIGAPARVARILKAKGPSGVLAEITLIEGSWAKRVYFSELLKTSSLDAQAVRAVLAQAGKEIDSDFELASLLIGSADRLLVDDATRQAYLEASKSIQSDFEMRRVYASALERGPLSSEILAGILDASTAIDSDFEEASLLIQVARLQPPDNRTRAPFFKALATVDSDFEHRRVLSALTRSDSTPDNISALLDSSAAIGSDFEQASLLLDVVKAYPIEGPLRAPFFRVVDTIDSAFERGRVLQAVAKRGGLSPETLVAVLRAAQGMKSSFETSQVLITLAATHQIAGEARDLYVVTAGRLGDFEEGRALTALVKNERVRR